MGSISRKEPEEDPRSGAERRSGGGMREGMHRGNLLIPQSRDDTTREPAPNAQTGAA